MRLVLFVACVVFGLSCFVFSVWCAVKGYVFAKQIHSEKRGRSGSGGTIVRRVSALSVTQHKSLFETVLGLCHLTANDLTIIYSSLCLFSGVATQLGILCLQLLVLIEWIKRRDHPYERPRYQVCLESTVLLFIISFTFSFLTLFERLSSCFIHTNHKLQNWHIRVVWLMGLLLFIAFLGLQIFPSRSTVPTLMLGFIAVEYIFGCIFLLHAFVSRIFLVAGNVTSLDDAINDKLINVGVKMTVCVGIALVSSMIDFAIIVSQSVICSREACGLYLEWIPTVVAEFDIVMNCFSILCTLGKSQAYYMYVFGCIHQKCLKYLIDHAKPPSNKLTLQKVQMPSNSAASSVNADDTTTL